MNFATTKLNGVSTITSSVTHTFLENMKISVTTIVTIPENNCVNPNNRPSDKISVSYPMVKLHQCGSTVRLSVNGRGRRDLLIGR